MVLLFQIIARAQLQEVLLNAWFLLQENSKSLLSQARRARMFWLSAVLTLCS